MTILLNADVGEGLASDLELYPHLDQASIACGGHVGDGESMRHAVTACLRHRIIIGAHPSYPDKANFGRVSMPIKKADLIASLTMQISGLDQVCAELGTKLSYVKPHGALYNDMMAQPEHFLSILTAIQTYPKDLALMIGAMPTGQQYQDAAEQVAVPLIQEAFADRRYLDNGHLQSRTVAGAVHADRDTILAQVSELIEHGSVTTASGKLISVRAESLCLHGDNRASVDAVTAISQHLRA